MIQHVNADFPYDWGESDDAEMMAYRSTDHDLPLMVVNLPTDTEPVEVESAEVEATAVPEPAEAEPVEAEATAVPEPAESESVEAEPAEAEQSANSWGWLLGGALFGAIVGGGMVLISRKKRG